MTTINSFPLTTVSASTVLKPFQFTYSSTTTDADPGDGKLRLNNATAASATAVYIDNQETGGTDISDWLDTFDDGGNSTKRGTLVIYQTLSPGAFNIYSVSGSVTDGTGYRKLTVSHVTGSGDFTDGKLITIGFSPHPVASDAEDTLENKTLTSPVINTSISGTAIVDEDDMASDSATKVPTQQSVKAYVDQITAANDAMVFKGVQDCSANPNYPAADRGDTYRVSVAGRIGGAAGVVVEAGDLFMCLTDGTAAGNQATVGTSWTVAQTNLDGAVIGPASATDGNFAQFDGATGKLIKGGLALNVDVQAFDADTLKADTADTLTAGFATTTFDAGTKSSGTFTPDEANGNFQKAVNGGAHTLAPPTNECNLVIQYTNGASAGAITTSGFTKVTGDTPTTTEGDDFLFYITKINSLSHLNVVALQ